MDQFEPDMDTPSRAPLAKLQATRLGLDTHHHAVAYLRYDSAICRSNGLASGAVVELHNGSNVILATAHIVISDIIDAEQIGLSELAWQRLSASDGVEIGVRRSEPVESLSGVRSKIYGNPLSLESCQAIINDVVADRLSDIYITAFLTSCAGDNLDEQEMTNLTQAMVKSGERFDWGTSPIVDKHCVGGLPGNRTTPIIVAIVTACGLTMPKTSSRSITSPAGTADTMETMAPVELDIADMRRVVEQEGGCIVWGGGMQLSPADDKLIRIERQLDIDSEGQLVASVLSKKVAAGATHLILDLPTGPSAKVRTPEAAQILGGHLVRVASHFGIEAVTHVTDGSQPVGRGIGPALEARDVMAVLHNSERAPVDLKTRSLNLAGALLEMAGKAPSGSGFAMALATLESGAAWKKFQAICEAQGGFREPPTAAHSFPVTAAHSGVVELIDNRLLARVAKYAGAPEFAAAGIQIYHFVGDRVNAGQPLFSIHAETPGELSYAQDFVEAHGAMVHLGELP